MDDTISYMTVKAGPSEEMRNVARVVWLDIVLPTMFLLSVTKPYGIVFQVSEACTIGFKLMISKSVHPATALYTFELGG